MTTAFRHQIDDVAQLRLAADLLVEMVVTHPDRAELAERLRAIADRVESAAAAPVVDKPAPFLAYLKEITVTAYDSTGQPDWARYDPAGMPRI